MVKLRSTPAKQKKKSKIKAGKPEMQTWQIFDHKIDQTKCNPLITF